MGQAKFRSFLFFYSKLLQWIQTICSKRSAVIPADRVQGFWFWLHPNSCGETEEKGYRGLKNIFTQPSILLIDRAANVWPVYPVVSDLTDEVGGMDHKEKETKKVKVHQGGGGDIMQVEGLLAGESIL